MKNSSAQLVAAACLLWAFAAFTRKLVLVSLSPFLLNFLNCIFAVIIVASFSKLNIENLLITLKQNIKLFLINSITGVTLGLSFAYYALERIDLGLYGLLVKLQPIFVILLAFFFLNEKISYKKIPIILAAIISSFFLAYDVEQGIELDSNKLFGIIAAILTAFCLSISTISGKALINKGLSPNQTTLIRFFLGGILLIPALFIEPLIKTNEIAITTIFWLSIGIFSNAYAFILYYKGLKNLEAVKATIIELIMPVLSVIFGYIFLDESLSILQITASISLLLCIVKLQIPE